MNGDIPFGKRCGKKHYSPNIFGFTTGSRRWLCKKRSSDDAIRRSLHQIYRLTVESIIHRIGKVQLLALKPK
jgi:hypothetical protein